MSAPRLNMLQKFAILAEYEAGVRVTAIAAKYGVHQTYPGLLAKRYGLVLRQARRPA